MSLPKDGMTLAKNDDILLRAVSERSKGLYVPRIQEAGIHFILVKENEEVEYI